LKSFTNLTIAAFLTSYLFFTVGLAYFICNYKVVSKISVPYSLVLSGVETGLIGLPTTHDIECVNWLLENDNDTAIIADYNGRRLLISYLPSERMYILRQGYRQRPVRETDYNRYYIFFTEWNTENRLYIRTKAAGLRIAEKLKEPDLPIAFQRGEAKIYEKEK